MQPDVSNPDNTESGYQGVSLNMTLLSTPLKQAGYTTRFVGKWDIGMASSQHHPKHRGFDSWFGYWHHANDYWYIYICDHMFISIYISCSYLSLFFFYFGYSLSFFLFCFF